MGVEDADTAPLPVVRPKRRRIWPFVVLIVVVVLVAGVAIAFPIVDAQFRRTAEQQIETDVQNGLPSGVQGFATATIHGPSALEQYWSGHFDDVSITFADLHVNGQPATASAEVHDLPVNAGRIGSATVHFGVDQATVRALAPLSGTGASPPTLGNGTVRTTVTQKVLTLTVLVEVTLKAALAKGVVTLRPTAATIKTGPISVPATQIVQALYPNGISVCAAKYLPVGVTLTGLAVKPSGVTLSLAAKDVELSTLQSGGTGHC